MYYIPQPENIVADDMSRIPMIEDTNKVKKLYTRNICTTIGSFARTGYITEECPLDVVVISRYQKMEHRQLREYLRDKK